MSNIYDNNDSIAVTLQPQTAVEEFDNSDQLVATHLSLVKTLACYVMFRFENSYTLCLDDLISAGDEALVLASRSFDPTKGVPFAAYARRAVVNAMHKEVLRLLPVNMKSAWRTDFTSFSYGKAFDDSVFNLDESECLEHNMLKLNENLGWLCNWNDEEQDLQARLRRIIDRLAPEDRKLIEDYFGFNGEALTLKKLGEQRSITLQAVEKRKARIIRQLQNDFDYINAYSKCA